jgi:spermidine synthase
MQRHAAVLAIFVLSGAAGLIYEIVWSRQLVLVFGNTSQAVSAILTGFFGGMAIGGAIGGRIADRVRSPLRLYGLIEVALVAIVLATPVTFDLLHEVYRGAYGQLSESPQLLALIRLLLALVGLGPATVLMGATLPALTRHLTPRGHLSGAFGRLYAANTFGAIAGTLLAGLVLIELLGLSGALLVGAACSGVAGVLALVLARGAREETAFHPVDAALRPEAGWSPRVHLALAVAFTSGLTSLGYQVLWTRLLASGSGNSTYVFTLILAVFLYGIAVGAVVFSVFRRRLGDPVRVLAGAQVVVALLAVAGIWLLNNASSTLDPGRPLESVQVLVPLVIIVVFPATLVMGLSFPAASALLSDDRDRIGASAGSLLALNTVGAIVGSFAVPFLLVPLVGSPFAVGLLALINTSIGTALALSLRAGRPRGLLSLAGCTVAAVIVAAMLAPGLLVHPAENAIVSAGGIVFESREDEIASVQAGQVHFTPELWVSGTSMTLLTVDAKLMPLLPLIARPDAESALIVAFGMGSSFRSALIAGLRADAVELVPSVPELFHWYYADGPEVLANPDGRVIVADGRNYLGLTEQRYDIIVTDPPPPIESAGASVISSLEYYATGRDRLRPDGVMMQWLPWGSSIDEFRAHVRSFAAVFPEVLIAFAPGGHGAFLLGSESPVVLDPDRIGRILERPGVVADLSSAYDAPATSIEDWIEILGDGVWISGEAVHAFAEAGPLITDDRPVPEYFLLRRWLGATSPQATEDLLRSMTSSTAADRPVRH